MRVIDEQKEGGIRQSSSVCLMDHGFNLGYQLAGENANELNYIGVHLYKGADASALFMSVIETAKRNGLNVFGYLSYLMLVLPSWGKTPSEEQLDSIMPWSDALPETCHRTYHQIIENEAEVK